MKMELPQLPDHTPITLTVGELKDYIQKSVDKLLASAELHTSAFGGYPAEVKLTFEGSKTTSFIRRNILDLVVEGAERGLDANTALRLKKVMETYIQWFPSEAKYFMENNNNDMSAKYYISLNDPIWEKVRDWQPQDKD